MDSTGEWLFVANSNADLRYNDGTLVALRLARAAEDRRNRGVTVGRHVRPRGDLPAVNYVRPLAESPDFCCIDPLDPYILNCDERRYVESRLERPHRQLRGRDGAPGSAVQHQPDGPSAQTCDRQRGSQGTSRLLIAVRGDTSLTYVDVKPERKDADGNVRPVFDCVGDAHVTATQWRRSERGPFASCDQDHRIVETESALALTSADADPPLVRFPDEPYALAVDEDNGLLYVGHLAGSTNRPGSGGVSLFDVAAVNDVMQPPRFIATLPHLRPQRERAGGGHVAARGNHGRAGVRDVALPADGHGTGRDRPRSAVRCAKATWSPSARSPCSAAARASGPR